MAKYDFKTIMIMVLVTYAVLFAFSLIGVLKFVTGLIPITGTVSVGGYTYPPLAALIAIVALAVVASLIAAGVAEGIANTKAWDVFFIIAGVSAALWILLPQFLPAGIKWIAGSAQSLFTGVLPQALLAP